MNFIRHFLILTLSTGLISSTHAQMGPPLPGGTTVYNAELLTVLQSNAGLDAGGAVALNQIGLKVNLQYGLDAGNSIGGSIGYSQDNYKFSGIPGTGGFAPWDDIQQWDLNLQYRHTLDRTASLFVMPMVRYSGEKDASSSDSLLWGGIVGYTKIVSKTLSLGIGGGAFSGLEETKGFPFIFVYWQINEDWRLSNHFRPGPSGQAGFEFVYTGLKDWELGFGGGYRSNRFALDNVGVAPGGYGENTAIPLFARLSREFKSGGHVDLYAGALVGGELQLEDSRGRKLSETKYDSSLLVALSFSQRW